MKIIDTFGICILGMILGFSFGIALNSDSWRQELVDKGYAEWYIDQQTKEIIFKYK